MGGEVGRKVDMIEESFRKLNWQDIVLVCLEEAIKSKLIKVLQYSLEKPCTIQQDGEVSQQKYGKS